MPEPGIPNTAGPGAASRGPIAGEGGTSAIAAVETRLLDIPLIRPHKFSVATMSAQGVVLVKVVTVDGIVGWGEGVVPGGPWWGGEAVEGMASLIERHLAPLVVGHDVLRPEAVALKLEKIAAKAPFARAGVEMAVWDAAGRTLGVPVHQLLGGLHRDRLPVVWALGTESVDMVVDEARRLLAEGRHTSFKLKMGAAEPDADTARIVAIADALGPTTTLAVDLNGAWDEYTARRWLPRLADAGIRLIEQPVPASSVDALARLRERSDAAIMADESVWTPADALRLSSANAVDVLALKIGKSGGLSAVRRMAAIADAAGLGCYGGTTIETSLGTAASAHLFGALPRLGLGTELFGPLLLADDITTKSASYDSGDLVLTSGPGFGVTVDEEKVAKYERN